MNYMLCKWVGTENNAAVKATNDVNAAFEKIGGELVLLWNHNKKIVRNIEEVITFLKMKRKVTSSDNLIIQWPLYSIKPYDDEWFTKLPHKKLICFIQDIESYRYNPEDNERLVKDINFLNRFDVVIAHNHGMIEFLRNNGLRTNVVDWQICDYLIDRPRSKQFCGDRYKLCFVGNLQRSGFLRINDSSFQTHINLYGAACDDLMLSSRLLYKGVYNPDEKTCELEGQFGLMWEGNSMETCDGALGNYMKINNPNRLSLYLANDIPVIVWKKSGLAKFVEMNDIGFTVDSLSEIDSLLQSLSVERYSEMLDNAKSVGEKIRNGVFARMAIEHAINGKYF